MTPQSSASLLDHPLISDRYFFPRPGRCPEPFWVDCGDARLACCYLQVEPAAGTLVHFHGNGEIVDDYLEDFVDLVAQMGWNCLLVEYRGYGERLYQWAAGKKRLLKFARGDHNDLMFVNAREYFNAMGDFLQSLARTPIDQSPAGT